MLDLIQNVFDCFGPHERRGVLVRESNELVDRREQFRHAREDVAPNPLARDLPEPSFDQVQLRGTRRRIDRGPGLAIQHCGASFARGLEGKAMKRFHFALGVSDTEASPPSVR